MKYRHVGVVLVCGLALNAIAFGQVHVCHGHSHLRCGKGTLPALTANGHAELVGTKILGNTVVNGHLVARNANLNMLTVNGHAKIIDSQIHHYSIIAGHLSLEASTAYDLKVQGHLHATNSTINGNTNVLGTIHATKTRFNGPIETHSTTMYLNDVTARNITVKNAYSIDQPPCIYLVGKTLVNGSIKFLTERGAVVLATGSQVKGKVFNGKLYTQNNAPAACHLLPKTVVKTGS